MFNSNAFRNLLTQESLYNYSHYSSKDGKKYYLVNLKTNSVIEYYYDEEQNSITKTAYTIQLSKEQLDNLQKGIVINLAPTDTEPESQRHYFFSKNGLLINFRNSRGEVIHYEYDDNGNLLREITELDLKQTFTFYESDALGRYIPNSDDLSNTGISDTAELDLSAAIELEEVKSKHNNFTDSILNKSFMLHELANLLEKEPINSKILYNEEQPGIKECLRYSLNFFALEKILNLLPKDEVDKIATLISPVTFCIYVNSPKKYEVFSQQFPKITEIFTKRGVLKANRTISLTCMPDSDIIQVKFEELEVHSEKTHLYFFKSNGELSSRSSDVYTQKEIDDQPSSQTAPDEQVVELLKLATHMAVYFSSNSDSSILLQNSYIFELPRENLGSSVLTMLKQNNFLLPYLLPAFYLIQSPADKINLSRLITDIFIKKSNPCTYIEVLNIISNVCKLYLLPFQTLTIDNIKIFYHGLEDDTDPFMHLLRGHLLIQAVWHGLDKKFNPQTLEIMLTDAIRCLLKVLVCNDQLLKEAGKNMLEQIANTHGEKFEVVRELYKQIQYRTGEVVDPAILSQSKNLTLFGPLVFKPYFIKVDMQEAKIAVDVKNDVVIQMQMQERSEENNKRFNM